MESNDSDQFARALGTGMLAVAGICGFWVFNSAIQLWNDTENVPMVKYVIKVAEASPLLKTPSGAIELPAYMPLGMAIFFCLMVISGIALLTKALIEGACILLVPEGIPMLKRIKAELEHIRKTGSKNAP